MVSHEQVDTDNDEELSDASDTGSHELDAVGDGVVSDELDVVGDGVVGASLPAGAGKESPGGGAIDGGLVAMVINDSGNPGNGGHATGGAFAS